MTSPCLRTSPSRSRPTSAARSRRRSSNRRRSAPMLPEMPLFLTPEVYVPLPLEATYQLGVGGGALVLERRPVGCRSPPSHQPDTSETAPPMKITRILAYRVELPLHEGSYKWSGGKSVTVFDSTIVAVETDAGITGYGEVCPLGPFYLPAYASGVRAGIAELGPHLLGEDPPQLGKLNRRMDAALQGPPLRQVGDRHGLLGHPRQGDGPAGLRAAGRPLRRRLRPLPGDLAGVARGDGRQRRRLSRRGLSPVPAQGRRRSRRSTSPASAPSPPSSQPGDRLDRRRQHRLADARRPARRPGGARRRRLHRAALPELRGMPDDPPALRPSVRARRGDRLARRPACAATPTGRWTW